MAVHENVLKVVERVYSAALDDGDWTAALAGVVALTGSRACCAEVRDPTLGEAVSALIVNYDHLDVAALSVEYQSHYVRLDPEWRFARDHPDARLFHDYIDPRYSQQADPAFAEFGAWERRKLGRCYHLTGLGSAGRAHRVSLTLDRSASQGPAGSAEIALFSALWPSVEKSFQIALRLGTLESVESLGLQRLAAERNGVLLLDSAGRLLFANPAAERLFGENDGLAAKGGALRVGLPEVDRRFRRMVAAAASRRIIGAEATQGYLRVPRPSGRGLPYVLQVAPCPASERYVAARRPSVIVLISDPECGAAPAAREARAAFGLSEREAALAARLCLGETLDEAARRLGMRRETARSHLAGAFAKTGTRRQHALVALLMGSLSGLG